MIGGRAASPASRESPSGKRHIGTMKTVSARQANHEFSDLLSRVEHGEEILIRLRPYRLPLTERKNAIQHQIDVMANGLSWGGTLKRSKRDEMHES